MSRLRLIVLMCVGFLVAPPAGAQRNAARAIDSYVEASMKTWGVPGVAIAVVRNDSVIFARGYGVREIGKPERVNERTLFAVGSTTKAFTAAAVGMLVDEKKLRWDDPVATFLPGFQLHDPFATRELSVRDLLTHRSGLSRGDRLWYASGYEREEVLRRVRHLRPSWTFRSTYGYQNIMFLAAGQVVQSVTGTSWDDFVTARIFKPLGMTSSTTTVTTLEGRDNLASPHVRIDGEIRPVPWRNLDNVGPAGSINSNAAEMAEWIRLQLGGGTYRGQRLLSREVMREMHAPQIVIRMTEQTEKLYPMTHLMAYGLAWTIKDYRGRKFVGHGGAIDGMRAEVGMLPEEKLGVVVLTNLGGTSYPTAILHRVLDTYLGVPDRDWSTVLRAASKEAEMRADSTRRAIERDRVSGTNPSLPLDRYAGTYADSLYGEVKIAHEGGKLRATFGPMYVGALEHWHFDTFRAVWDNPVFGRAFVTFALDARAKVAGLTVENVGEFKRVPDEEKTAAAAGSR